MRLVTPGVSPAQCDAEGVSIPIVLPVGPPTRQDGCWELGQPGNRRLTEEETLAVHQHMRRCAAPYHTVNLPVCDPFYYKLDVCVWFKRIRAFEEGPLTYNRDDEEASFQFFCGRIHWWWFLGDRVYQVGKHCIVDPERVVQ